MKLFDSHAHLQLGLGLGAAKQIPHLMAGYIGLASTHTADWPLVESIGKTFPAVSPSSTKKVYPSYGIHPWCAHADEFTDCSSESLWINQLEGLLRAQPYACVGEIGLDKISAKREGKGLNVQGPLRRLGATSASGDTGDWREVRLFPLSRLSGL